MHTQNSLSTLNQLFSQKSRKSRKFVDTTGCSGNCVTSPSSDPRRSGSPPSPSPSPLLRTTLACILRPSLHISVHSCASFMHSLSVLNICEHLCAFERLVVPLELCAYVSICVHFSLGTAFLLRSLPLSLSLFLTPLLAPERSFFGRFSSGVVMEEQGLPGEGAVDGNREKKVAVTSRGLAEGRERLEKITINWHLSVQRELDSMREVFKVLEEEQASWRRERELMEGELCRLRSEVEQLQAAAAASAPPQICDVDRGSEEIDLTALAEHKWLENRQVLAPITPEAVRARTPVAKQGGLGNCLSASGKENYRSSAEEIPRLRRDNEQLRDRASKLSKENKSLKTQYHSLITKYGSGLKGDVGYLNTNQDNLPVALEAGLEKPAKIRRRSLVEAQVEGGDGKSRGHSPDMNAPSTPLPQSMADVVTGPTASTSGSRDCQAKVKAEPVHLESLKAITQGHSTKDITAGVPDAGHERKPDRATGNSALAGNRKRSLESLGKQPAKPPAFKFVEPVRKKAERENLQATECKLCKKFYDAVIAGDTNGMAEARCTHVDKSRHRFRNLPPETPEGFWNIGFDSDF